VRTLFGFLLLDSFFPIKKLELIQTTILMLDGISDSELMFKHNMGGSLLKARRIKQIVRE